MIQQDRINEMMNAPASDVGIDFVPDLSATSADPLPSRSAQPESVSHPDMFDGLDGWQNFELMPPRYRAKRQAERALLKWSGVLLVLLSITIGSSIALEIRGRRTTQRNADLIAEAKPLSDLRDRSQILDAENALLEKWCHWVETSKPDDSIVQVLGAVALATHHRDAPGPDEHLDVQSIDIKLPLEHDATSSVTPTWAEPKFSLTAVARSRDVLMPWNDRLEKTGRLQNVKLTTPAGSWREAVIQVNAIPLASRIVP